MSGWLPPSGGGTVQQGNPPWAVSEANGANVVLGALAGSAITTDADGTVHDYIRGLVKLLGTTGISALVQQAVAANLNAQVVGNVGHGAADAGNPAKGGGKYNAAGVSIADLQRGDFQLTPNCFLKVSLGDLISGEDQVNNLLRVSNVGGFWPTGTALNTFAARITLNGTTTLTASTAYVSSIVIATEVAGTTSTVKVQDKSGTPKVLVPALATVGISTAPTTLDFQTPLLMTGGIDIITAGAASATIDVWVNYYQ